MTAEEVKQFEQAKRQFVEKMVEKLRVAPKSYRELEILPPDPRDTGYLKKKQQTFSYVILYCFGSHSNICKIIHHFHNVAPRLVALYYKALFN